MTPQHTEEQWSHWFDTLATNDFVYIDGFLSENQRIPLIDFFSEKEKNFQPAKVGQAQIEKRMPEIRSDMTFWLDKERDISIRYFFDLIEQIIERIKRELFLSLQGYEFHFALYPPGGFYKPHLDQFDSRSNRMISFILYLNENWEPGDGGELRIHKDNDFFDIQPLMNRAVIFRSDCVLHEVLPALKMRKSITGWLLKRPSGVGVLGI